MTKKEWNELSEVKKIEYVYHLGWKSCQGTRAGLSADKEIVEIMIYEQKLLTKDNIGYDKIHKKG